MPRLQTLLGALNTAFSRSEIAQTAHGRDSFAPGQPLGDALAGMVSSLGSPMYLAFRDYVSVIPGSIQESIRSSLHYALSTDPPTLVIGAWAPGYDYEVTVWQAPDTEETRGGITLLIKSRYPGDPHPLDCPPSAT